MSAAIDLVDDGHDRRLGVGQGAQGLLVFPGEAPGLDQEQGQIDIAHGRARRAIEVAVEGALAALVDARRIDEDGLAAGMVWIPRMAWRVVWALWEVMASFRPRMRFSSVDLPTLGRPTMATWPQRWGASGGGVGRGLDVMSDQFQHEFRRLLFGAAAAGALPWVVWPSSGRTGMTRSCSCWLPPMSGFHREGRGRGLQALLKPGLGILDRLVRLGQGLTKQLQVSLGGLESGIHKNGAEDRLQGILQDGVPAVGASTGFASAQAEIVAKLKAAGQSGQGLLLDQGGAGTAQVPRPPLATGSPSASAITKPSRASPKNSSRSLLTPGALRWVRAWTRRSGWVKEYPRIRARRLGSPNTLRERRRGRRSGSRPDWRTGARSS